VAETTGNGATVVLTTDTFAASIIDANLGGWSLGMLDASHLGTTDTMEKVLADLAEEKPLSFNYFVDIRDDTKWAPTKGLTDTLTITFPSQTAGTDATLAMTGGVTDVTHPTLANNQLAQGSFEFTPDGKTGPTFTEEAAS
jgi:hypothetical protein